MNRVASIALAPLSGLYSGFVRSGNALYRRDFFRALKVGAPVISVGNLTTGGTGKTPLVEWIARELAESGRRVCILTRGYRRESSGRVIVSNGNEIFVDASLAGDEPFLLAETLKGQAAVICDADRVAAASWAKENLRINTFVLDDGFQHQRIARDLNIVTIDATNPWGNGRLLPAGILREPRQALTRADAVVITRADDPAQVAELRQEIEGLNSQASVFTCRTELKGFHPLNSGNHSLADLATTPVSAFCAVGNPESFFSLLQRNGYDLRAKRQFRDHHKYSRAEIGRIARAAVSAGAQALLTTAKDAVKIRSFNFPLPCYAAEITITIDRSDDFRELLMKAINGHQGPRLIADQPAALQSS
jgi:tetraacyldisaccharide 4'-kinase